MKPRTIEWGRDWQWAVNAMTVIHITLYVCGAWKILELLLWVREEIQ